MILLFCLIGAYTINNTVFGILVMSIFGVLGYLFKKFGYEPAPMVLAFVLGPLLDLNLRQALLMSEGSFLGFFTKPISAVTLGIAILLLLSSVLPFVGKKLQNYKESTKDD
jgi:putative tricarboxylic transport membrane protein